MRQLAIDGPAGAGKSTIAKKLAAEMGFMYVDTGAMYRTIALACIRSGADLDNEMQVSEACAAADIKVTYMDAVQHMLLDGNDVSAEIRKEEVGKGASKVSRFRAVRTRLVAMQQQISEEYDVVMDGRDIGTKVLPHAECKIYLTASVDCRAKRRYDELTAKGEACDYEVIKKDIAERDEQDMHRAISPLVKADDAIKVDTSGMTIEQVTEKLKALYAQVK